MKIVGQSLILILSFISVFVLDETPAGDYTIEAVAILIMLYFFLLLYRRKKHIDMFNTNGLSDIFILNTVILLLIIMTGAIYSPLYFLVYFLAFGITFIFEPATAFLFAIGAIAIFIPEALKNYSLESFIKVGSILLISPLAYFFGQGYKDREKSTEKNKKEKQ